MDYLTSYWLDIYILYSIQYVYSSIYGEREKNYFCPPPPPLLIHLHHHPVDISKTDAPQWYSSTTLVCVCCVLAG
jgi:hypothetical protein